jgi:GMP synthase (glutamine-hydrolysing)
MRPRALIVQLQDDAPPGQLGDALAARNIDADVCRPDRGDPVPAAADGFAGIVVLGGSMGARDDGDFPWLARVRTLLAAVEPGVAPALGLCLGAQLAAVALGGDVTRRPGGFEIGWFEARPTAAGGRDPVVAALGAQAPLVLWHQDAFTPPPGAVPLIGGGLAFRRGAVWALQHHPEADAAVLRGWCDSRGAARELAEAGTAREQLLAGAEELAAGGRRLLDAWCGEVVKGVRPRARGR